MSSSAVVRFSSTRLRSRMTGCASAALDQKDGPASAIFFSIVSSCWRRRTGSKVLLQAAHFGADRGEFPVKLFDGWVAHAMVVLSSLRQNENKIASIEIIAQAWAKRSPWRV